MIDAPPEQARDMTAPEYRAALQKIKNDQFTRELQARDAADLAAAQKRMDHLKGKTK